MWKLEIYPSLLEGAPIERHDCEGSLGAWLDACEIKWREEEEQPIIVSLDSLTYPVSEWDKELPVGAVLKIRVIPRKSVFKFIGKIFKAIMKLFGVKTPKALGSTSSPAQKALDSAEVTANTAKLGEVVPEIAGTYRKYPDYLVQPHRYFSPDDPRTQIVQFHACIGPGFYRIPPESVKIGNTPIGSVGLNRALYSIYTPGTLLTDVPSNENWYTCPEVGSTSNGSAGIELLAEIVDFNNINSFYTIYSNYTVVRTTGTWPTSWATGVTVSINPVRTYQMQFAGSYYVGSSRIRKYALTGNFRDLLPITLGNYYAYGSNYALAGGPVLKLSRLAGELWTFDCVISSYSLDANGDGYVIVDSPTNIDNSSIVNGAFYFYSPTTAYRLTITSTTSATISRVVRNVASDPVNYGGWVPDAGFAGFANGSLPTEINYIVGDLFGSYSASFSSCPPGELTTKLELDFFFPSGLSYVNDSGTPSYLAVVLDVSIISDDGTYTDEHRLTYTGATVDQIGYTAVFPLPRPLRPIVRVRRVTQTHTQSNYNSKVVWYALKAQLKNVSMYPNWTTMGVMLRSGGKLGQGAESSINLMATRLLPTISNEGVLTPSGFRRYLTNVRTGPNTVKAMSLVEYVGATPTRDISAFFTHIARTAGYDVSQLDLVELGRLEAIWRDRGDTFNYIFDETTVKDALDLVLNAGFAETTVEDGILKPVRNSVRTQFEQAYSPQNMVGPLVRKFQAPAPDETDGVEVDYMDERTWTRKTLVCALSGSSKARLEKVKVEGVTDRDRAWRLGMRRMYELIYRRWSYSFSTELDGMCSNYLSYVPLFDDLPEHQQSALVTALVVASPNTYRVIVTEPIKWSEYTGGTVTVAFRGRTGKVSPYFTCSQITEESNDYVFAVRGLDYPTLAAWLQASSGLTLAERTSGNIDINLGEPLHVYIGRTDRFCFPALITAVKPGDNNEVNIDAVNYDARIYQADDSSPPSDI